MKDIGYGKGYAYDHDADQGFSGQDYWPEEMGAQTFYEPSERGFEARIAERIAYWNELRGKRKERRITEGDNVPDRSAGSLLARPVIQWGPKLLFAVIILVATHFVAKAVQWGVEKLIDRVPVLKRHPQAGVDSSAPNLGDCSTGWSGLWALLPHFSRLACPVSDPVDRDDERDIRLSSQAARRGSFLLRRTDFGASCPPCHRGRAWRAQS